mgnify:CR=1 FL=1
MKLLISLIYFLFSFSILESKDNPKDPHDDDLRGKNLICYNDSLSVEDWGIKFLKNNEVKTVSYTHLRAHET